jgi:hypothetical protein
VVHHHHHHAGEAHPPAALRPSILRWPVAHRLLLAAALITLLWISVFWAMGLP